MNVTTHLPDTPEQDLLEKKGGRGFPYVVVMDASGEVLEEFRPTDEKAVRRALDNGKFFVKLRDAAMKNPGDKAAQASFKLYKAIKKRDDSKMAELETLAQTKGVDAKVLKQFASFKTSMKVQKILQDAQGKATSRDEFFGMVAPKVYELAKTKPLLSEDDPMYPNYHVFAMHGAVEAKDKMMAEASIAALESWLTSNVPAEYHDQVRRQMGLSDAKAKLKDLDKKSSGKGSGGR